MPNVQFNIMYMSPCEMGQGHALGQLFSQYFTTTHGKKTEPEAEVVEYIVLFFSSDQEVWKF
jgi:methionine salvage enolase-phosphatase E1